MCWHEKLLVVAPAYIETFAVPPTRVTVPFYTCSTAREAYVADASVSVMGTSQKVPIGVNVSPSPVAPRDLMTALESTDDWVRQELGKRGVYSQAFIDVSHLNLPEGTHTFVHIVVRARVGRRLMQSSIRVPYRVSALPHVQGWYGGDGHVHTSWSPDVWFLPIDHRARYAKENGFGFIIVTDHADGITDWSSPQGYVAQCNQAQERWGISVLPGAEISSLSGGHYLAYGFKETGRYIPRDREYLSQDLIDCINANNPPHSFGAIAHPFDWLNPWKDLDVSGFSCVELMNRQRKPTQKTLDFWMDSLRKNLNYTLRTGLFPVAIANSDCHNLQMPGEKGFNWVNIHQYSPENRKAVWEALRKGRVSASGSKDFACLTVNGAKQGEIIRAYPGETLELRLTAAPVTGRRCYRAWILDSSGHKTRINMRSTEREVTVKGRAPIVSGFFTAGFEFRGRSPKDASEVWTNPVFVQVEI